jgi:hypothetical protein
VLGLFGLFGLFWNGDRTDRSLQWAGTLNDMEIVAQRLRHVGTDTTEPVAQLQRYSLHVM